MRWLAAGIVTMIGLVFSLVRLPRRFKLPTLGGAIAAALAALALAVREAHRVRGERVTIPVEDLPPPLDGFKIVQLSDLHIGRRFTVVNAQRAVAWALDSQPDVVVLTGDFVSFSRYIPLLDKSLRGLQARYGCYAVLGNHDYWTDISAIERVLDRHGITLLRNEQRSITIDGAILCLVGIDCIWEGRHDPAVALRDLPATATTIVLAHEPDIADEISAYPVALQLSGHTHAGHIALPGLGPAFLPRHGFRYFRGLQQVGRMWVYTSRGLGGFPIRFGSSPEVTALTLRAARRTAR